MVGRARFRRFSLVDKHSRVSVAIEAGQRLTGEHVVHLLKCVSRERGGPQLSRVDNGLTCCSRGLDLWAYFNGVKCDFSRPRNHMDKAVIESFAGKLCDECLKQHLCLGRYESRAITEARREDYNRAHPHGAQGEKPPSECERPLSGHAQITALDG